MSRGKDYYKILEVDEDASEASIKRAYRKLALKYHPDKSKLPDATKRFQDISEAYSVLSDPSKRQRYDAGRRGTFQSFNPDDDFSSWFSGFDGGNFTEEDAFDVFAEFMYGGDIPEIFREDGMKYQQVDVPLEVAQNGGEIEVYIDGEPHIIYIDGIFSGKWKPFIAVGQSDTAILKVSFPPQMSLAERRRLQKVFLGLHAISLVANAVQKVVENHPFMGLLGIGVGIAALCLFKSK